MAAGPELEAECITLGGCPTGEARITKGYRLPAKYVIHAVGPKYWDGTRNEAALLRSCYKSIFRIATESHLSSVAIPALGNPGNSGGALIDAQSGIVVGVNASGFSKSVSEGLNFAVPSKQACNILSLLKQGKDPSPPVLPVTFATTSKERELVVAQSDGDWADMLKPGDRILGVNGDETARFSTRFVSYSHQSHIHRRLVRQALR